VHEPRPSRASRALLPILLVAVVLVVVLARRVQVLRAQLDTLREHATLLYPGYLLPAFEAQTVTGQRVTVGRAPPGTRQILVVFSTTCPYCLASLPAWHRLAEAAERDSTIEVIGLGVNGGDSVARYTAEHAIRFPVVVIAEPTLRFLYRTRVVPQTIVLEAEGRVVYARRGQLQTGAALDSVLRVARPGTTR
jgi:peroxiredoxin